nr:PEP-CTERM sorting domain-containing protein [Govania unica]
MTGDFLFSTYGGPNRILVISGFDVPVSDDVTEPAALGLLGLGLLGLGLGRRRKAT